MNTEKNHFFIAFDGRGDVMTLSVTVNTLMGNLYHNDNIRGFKFIGKDYKQHVITIIDHEGLWSVMDGKDYTSLWMLEEAIKELVYINRKGN